MNKEEFVGQIVGGNFGQLLIRKKSNSRVEIGELLISENESEKFMLMTYDIKYASQISQQNIDMISGFGLEESEPVEIFDSHIRNYTIVVAKVILKLTSKNATMPKDMPLFFSKVRKVNSADFSFLSKPKDSLFVGNIRAGTKELELPIYLPGKEVLSHHILLAATTGRGKSNLTSVLLWDIATKDYCGMLVLDPHDEYFKTVNKKIGLENHPNKEKICYYSRNPKIGGNTLAINIKKIRPKHFKGVINLSDAQNDAIYSYYKEYKGDWISALLNNLPTKISFNEATINVLKRKISNMLDVRSGEGTLSFGSIFNDSSSETTIEEICNHLESKRIVIIDTSMFSESQEILIGSIVLSKIFQRYQGYKKRSLLDEKPIISVIIEEAPRVLGKEVLELGPNIFSTIAREGRKFKIGLYAITQLPSLIPRTILANMNTKIIMGIEMKPERVALAESCPQDLENDEKNIASLDLGEAIISSTFTKFAIPVKIPYLNDFIEKNQDKDNFDHNKEKENAQKQFIGM